MAAAAAVVVVVWVRVVALAVAAARVVQSLMGGHGMSNRLSVH
jgi:hypothetical protein